MKMAGPYQIAQPYREVEMPVGRCFDIVELVLSFMVYVEHVANYPLGTGGKSVGKEILWVG
jgi:hypothetical protein